MEIKDNEILELTRLEGKQHFTQPPARYSEATLVKTLRRKWRETEYLCSYYYYSLTRGYIVKEKKVLYTTELGEIVNDILKKYFKNIVDVDFTAHMEEQLDEIENGDIAWKEIIKAFTRILKEL